MIEAVQRETLFDAVNEWISRDESGCMILVDETAVDGANDSDDLDATQRWQSVAIQHGIHLGLQLYLVQYGAEHGVEEVFKRTRFSRVLNDVIPADTKTFKKGLDEQNGFCNPSLVEATKGHQHAIIMGQSENACCSETAAGAACNGMAVHACNFLVRGGGTDTKGITQIVWRSHAELYGASAENHPGLFFYSRV